jgi:hypothetical protein
MTERNQRFVFRIVLTLIALLYVILEWDSYKAKKEWERQNQVVDSITLSPISRQETVDNIIKKTYLGDKYEPTNCE